MNTYVMMVLLNRYRTEREVLKTEVENLQCEILKMQTDYKVLNEHYNKLLDTYMEERHVKT